MSKRGLWLGFLGVVLLCGFTFFNDMVIRSTFLVGNFMPFSVLGTLLLFVLAVNPLLGACRRSWMLSGRELAVMVGLVLFVCFIPGRGLLHQFTTVLMLPHHYARVDQSWRSEDVRVRHDSFYDWSFVSQALREARPEDGGHVGLVKASLSEALLAELPAPGERPAPAFQNRLVNELNGLIEAGALAETVAVKDYRLPQYGRYLLQRGGELTEEDRRTLTRAAIDVAFEGGLAARHTSAVSLIPPVMLTDLRGSPTALDGFVSGVGEGNQAISLVEDIPWRAWRPTLLFWIPVILFMCVAGIGLSLVLHRQWTSHERLPYPTVELTRMLLPPAGHSMPPLFASKLFWLGLVPVLLIYLNNYAVVWWPDRMIPFRLRLELGPFVKLVPTYYRSGISWWTLFNPLIIFTVVGFAYFLPKDVSFSLGIAPFVFGYVSGTLSGYGISLGGTMTVPSIHSFSHAGAYVAMFLVIAYTGRRYYGSVLRRCVGIKRGGDEVEPHAVWGARTMLLGILGFVAATHVAGLELPVGLLYIIALLIILTVLSRLLAEAGVYYLHTNLFPCALLWGIFGEGCLGVNQLLILGLLSSALFMDPRECFMPFVVESLQLNDRNGKVGRLALAGMAAIVIGLAVALPATLYLQYKNGAMTVGDGWTTITSPRRAIDSNLKLRKNLEAQGALPLTDEQSFVERLGKFRPKAAPMCAFGVTFALVILFTVCRQRLPWWPLHPVMFLTLATWQSTFMAFSFLLGWLIKHVVTKFGGGKMYQDFKPVMAGIICGEFLAGLITLVISAVYYFIVGEPPKPFSVSR